MMVPGARGASQRHESFTHDQIGGLMDLLGVSKEAEDKSNAPHMLTGKERSQAPPNMRVAVKKRVKKDDQKAIWQPEEFKRSSGVVSRRKVTTEKFQNTR